MNAMIQPEPFGKKNDFFHNAKKNAFGSVFSKKKKKPTEVRFIILSSWKTQRTLTGCIDRTAANKVPAHYLIYVTYQIIIFIWLLLLCDFVVVGCSQYMCLLIYIFENIHSSYNVFFVATYLIVHRLVRTDVDAKRKRINCSVRFFFVFATTRII